MVKDTKQNNLLKCNRNDSYLNCGCKNRKKKLKKFKKIKASNGFEPVTSPDTGTMLYQPSHERGERCKHTGDMNSIN